MEQENQKQEFEEENMWDGEDYDQQFQLNQVTQQNSQIKVEEECKSKSTSKTYLSNWQKQQLERELRETAGTTAQLVVLEKKYNISHETIKKYKAQIYTYGHLLLNNEHNKIRYKRLSHQLIPFLVKLVESEPFLTQQEMAKIIKEQLDLEVPQQAISRMLTEKGYIKKTRKNTIPKGNCPANIELRYQYAKISQQFNDTRMLFWDQIGFTEIVERGDGYVPKGVTLLKRQQRPKTEKASVILIMNYEKIYHWKVVSGECLNEMYKDMQDWVNIMDNAKIHKDQSFRKAIRQKQMQLIYLPPCSPELNPVQELIRQLQNIYRGFKFSEKGTEVNELVGWLEKCCEQLVKGKKKNTRPHVHHFLDLAFNRHKFTSL